MPEPAPKSRRPVAGKRTRQGERSESADVSVDGIYILVVRSAGGRKIHDIAAGPFRSLREAGDAFFRIRLNDSSAYMSRWQSA
jgi:hypothetical protein